MTGRVSEAEWLEQVLDLARLYGWRTAHFRPGRTATGWRTPVSGDGKGFPDLVLARSRRVIFAELKSAAGRLSPDQAAWIAVLPDAYVWRPSDLDLVAGILRSTPGETMTQPNDTRHLRSRNE